MKNPRYQGGGSSHVNSFKVTSVWDALTEKENDKEENTYTVTIDNNTYHIISKFIGIDTSSKILYDLAVKRILYNDSI